ncbi:hypothetical protein L208DRAFT_1407492 [Tricholoma matsutake]|nr:hypothetical protein L208DRAFT_1407492 [Tricholoma matsutake 945]
MARISMLSLGCAPLFMYIQFLLFVLRSVNRRPNWYCNQQDCNNRSSYIGYDLVQSRLFFGLRDRTCKHYLYANLV